MKEIESTGFTVEQICSQSRKKELAAARQVICMLLRWESKTTTAIGKVINRDHATVIYSSKKAIDLIEIGDELAVKYFEMLKD